MASTDLVLRGTGARLSVTFYVDGVATDADGTVTVTVTDARGNVLASSEAAIKEGETGRYSWTLAPQSDLTRLTLEWTGTFSGISHTVTTYAEVIGAHLFSIEEARAWRGGVLSDASRFPTEDIVDVREEVTEAFERYCGTSFVPRYHRFDIDGNGTSSIWLLTRPLLKVQEIIEEGVSLVEGTDFASSRTGRIVRIGTVWPEPTGGPNITIHAEIGHEAPPGEIVRAALIVATSYLLGSDIMDRAITHQDETGLTRLSTADVGARLVRGGVSQYDRPYGIPYVDAVLNKWRDDIVAV